MNRKIKLVILTVHEKNLEKLLENFINFSGFQPVDPNRIIATVHGARSCSYENENPCDSLFEQIKQIENETHIIFDSKKINCSSDSIDSIRQYMNETYQQIDEKYKEIKSSEEEINKYEQALLQVKKITDMDVAFEDFFQAQFITFRFGKIPSELADRPNFYKQKPFIYIPFLKDKGQTWCLYLTTQEYEKDIDNLFASVFFERMDIPNFVSGTPESARLSLQNKIEDDKKQSEMLKEQFAHYINKHKKELDIIKGKLIFISDLYKARQYAVLLGDYVTITGFVEKIQIKKMKSYFDNVPSIEIETQEAGLDKRFALPTKIVSLF